MITKSFLLIILVVGVHTINCPNGEQPCGTNSCYDPTKQGCKIGNNTIECINSCNGTCYSNSQYCYNNSRVCNNGESVCDVKYYSYFSSYPANLTCYNSSQLVCYNNTLCDRYYSCGSQCLSDYNSACANNRTICSGFNIWSYYPYSYRYLNTCGPQQTCYDNTTSVCLNGTKVCPGLNARLCGANCFDSNTQICNNGTIRCINSCNGTCYSNSQYCYNNSRVCNNGESVCDVKYYNYFSSYPANLTCYNSSQLVCYNNTLCDRYYSCGSQCLSDYNSACANNRTICSGFNIWSYYPYSYRYLNTCGPQQTCYDNTTSVCLNGTKVCPGLNARLCGANCFDSNTQICNNGTIRCINSCNGTCYSNSQYCYNNSRVCNNGESVCDVKYYSYFSSYPANLTCYNSSQLVCYNNTLCDRYYSCGSQCLSDYNSACANNRTICSGFNIWSYYPYSYRYLNTCGPQQTCYDNTTSVCMNNNGTVCSIGSQLCSGICYDPQSQYCIGGNNSIYCLSNPTSTNCLDTTTSTIFTTTSTTSASSTIRTATLTTITPSTCCLVQNCTTNSDCCQPSSLECQCFRHNQTDIYGSCINPYVTPICGTSCPVRTRCQEDADCCACQCADISFTDPDGQRVTKKQCARR